MNGESPSKLLTEMLFAPGLYVTDPEHRALGGQLRSPESTQPETSQLNSKIPDRKIPPVTQFKWARN